MKAENFSDEEKKKIWEQYRKMSFAKIQRNILQDLINSKSESVIYSRYDRSDVIDMLEDPQRNESSIRELSRFIYIVSGHYRRLIDYFATILLYNYTIVPTKIPTDDIDAEKYKKEYIQVANLANTWNFKQEFAESIKVALRDGASYNIVYETEDSIVTKRMNPSYCAISSIEDNVPIFAINLDFFSRNKDLLPLYGKEFESAYKKYKPDSGGTQKENQWYEPKSQYVILADPTDLYYHLPSMTSILLSIFDIDDYKMLQKAKTENDNYKALSLQLQLDENGVPTMPYDMAEKYFDHIVDNINNDQIGLFLTPFEVGDHSFADTKTSDTNDVNDAEKQLFDSAGVSSGLFLSGLTSSSSILLSVKPDEQFAYSFLLQAERAFNLKIKKLNLSYGFKVVFLDQSIFNHDEYVKRFKEGASLGLPVKTHYSASLGLSPSDIMGLTYLEENILGLSKDNWLTPLVSSNTQGSVSSEDEGGRPTAEESGEILGEAGEASREQN